MPIRRHTPSMIAEMSPACRGSATIPCTRCCGDTARPSSFGGTEFNIVNAINESGEMAGQSGVPGNATVHAAFWKTPKTVVDLGTFPGDSYSLLFAINNKGQNVGAS